MTYLHLIGKELKCDDLLDLLDTHDVEVIYDYDRTHENIPDKYRATVHELGMQLRFDEQLHPLETEVLSWLQIASRGRFEFQSRNNCVAIFG